MLSTLHTNDAPSAVTRLIDIGVASYKIATAVKGILAQRLVRRVCGTCGGTAGARCGDCGGTGFHGRLALVEVLLATAEFERRVADGEPTERIAEAARASGMRSLWHSGMTHAGAGRTAVAEVLRVAEPDDGHVARTAAERPSLPRMTRIQVGTVDVFVIRPLASGWRVLALQRGTGTRCPSAWEPVHGHIEEDEEPEDAALRELREETGLTAERLYIVRVQPFYLRKVRAVELAIVFAAFVAEPADVSISAEHQKFEWLSVDEALSRFGFPGERASLREAVELLAAGNAGAVDDVMRIV